MTVFAGIEISPNSRFTVTGLPELAPGHCILCGAADSDRQYIDFGFQLDFFGAIYFCSHCFIEAAETVGFVPVSKVVEITGELSELKQKNEMLEERNAGLSKLVGNSLLGICDCSTLDSIALLPMGDAQEDASGSDSNAADAGKPNDAGKHRSGK